MLNREQKDFYSLTVLAIDNGVNRLSTTCQVYIRVLPQIELKPQLDLTIYNLNLSESSDFSKRPVILKVNALDKETNTSNNIIYSLSGSLNDLNTFEIDSSGSIRLVSKLNSKLKNSYKLNIIAKDISQQPACATYSQLNINILDDKQTSILFSAPFYDFILFENVPINSYVGQVYTIKPELSQITYSLDSSLSDIPFFIDSTNGSIYTNRKLYKSNKQVYEFYVSANLISSVKVKVKLLDINDQVPEFAKKVYKLNVSEDAAIGLPLLTLNVNNRDLNSILDYSIEEQNDEIFNLVKQTNNRVFLSLEKTNLNFKKKNFYEFKVKVIDQDGLYSMCKVEINVLPNIKYSPRFTKDIYTFQIEENLPIGSLVGTLTSVYSFYLYDNSNNNQVYYKLIPNPADASQVSLNDFKLDEQNGRLYISNELDREKYESVTLYATVAYRDKPFQTDHAIIQIQVIFHRKE